MLSVLPKQSLIPLVRLTWQLQKDLASRIFATQRHLEPHMDSKHVGFQVLTLELSAIRLSEYPSSAKLYKAGLARFSTQWKSLFLILNELEAKF